MNFPERFTAVEEISVRADVRQSVGFAECR
jgi:hypothetical protein